jgi:ferredoxin
VDEIECIGCMYCAQIARNTFFIEDDAGRARAFARQPVRKACA